MDNPVKENGLRAIANADFQAILEHQQDGIVILDDQHRILYLNQPAARLLNLIQPDSLGTSFPFAVAEHTAQELLISTDPACWVRITAAEMIWQGRASLLVQVRETTENKHEENRLSVAASAAETRAMELEALKFVADQLNQVVLRDDTILAALQTVLALYKTEMVWVMLPFEPGTYQMYAAYRAPSPVLSEKRIIKSEIKCMWMEKVLHGELTESCMLNLAECMAEIGFPPSIPVINYAIPLGMNGKPLGLLNLVPVDEEELSFNDFKALKTIGQQFALAIQRALPPSLAFSRPAYYAAVDLTGRAIEDELDLLAVTK
ncbi:MAG: PAS domain-containing protein, partial [Anaerolineaceae bacterium]